MNANVAIIGSLAAAFLLYGILRLRGVRLKWALVGMYFVFLVTALGVCEEGGASLLVRIPITIAAVVLILLDTIPARRP